MIGRELLNYKILEKLGEGGQGEVYKALDQNLKRIVAVKVLAQRLSNRTETLGRFKREAQLASSLEHPNICTIYELDEVDGIHFIVMQYVEGRNVRQLVNGKPLELHTALRIGIQVTDALTTAHTFGIIHRDIKANNVMVTETGLVKILDFGLAKLLEDDDQTDDEPSGPEVIPLTEIGSPYGTATYAAPEQSRGEVVDHRVDIFSTGVLLYEMLAGTWPFRGKNSIEVRYAVIHEQPLPIEKRRGAAIPTRLEINIDKSLAKSPAQRHQNIAELRDELVAVLREVSVADGETEAWLHRLEEKPPRALAREDLLVRAARWLSEKFRSGTSEHALLPLPTSIDDDSASGAQHKIGVLPFRNITGSNDSDFLSFALADAVISELATFDSLEVRPSAAIVKYTDGEVDPVLAARELKVDSLLTSSFIREGNRLHVTAQLLSVGSQDLIWSERITLNSQSMIELQTGIARRIAEGLRVELTLEQTKVATDSQDAALEAYLRGRDAMKGIIYDALLSYDEYLRGRQTVGGYIYPASNLEEIEIAMAHFRRAIEIDPDFASAHSSLGSCYISRAIRFAGQGQEYEQAKKAFDRALEIDPSDVEAKVNLAFFQMAQGEKEPAREIIAGLLEEAPSNVSVHFVNSYLNRLDGEYEKTLRSLKRVLSLNPGAKIVCSYNRARIEIFQGQYDKALAELDQGKNEASGHPLITTFRAMCLLLKNVPDRAATLMREVLAQYPDLDGVRPHLAMCLAALGEHHAARQEISDRVRSIANASHDITYWLATLYAMLGDGDEAFIWLEKTIELGNENLPWFESNPLWKSFFDDPRFTGLMATLRERRLSRRALEQPVTLIHHDGISA